MDNTFVPVNTQIRILRNKGLIIKNKTEGKKLLREIGYDKLIGNYKRPFLDRRYPYEKFIENTSIDEIYSLYEFDRKLRSLTLEYILIIEDKVKSIINYQFSKMYGRYNSLFPQNFDSDKKISTLNKFISSITDSALRVLHKDINPKRINSKSEPLSSWVIINLMTFGETSKFFSNMKQYDRVNVSKMFKIGVLEDELANYLYFLTAIRNWCAHSRCFYSVLTSTGIKITRFHKYFRRNSTNNYFCVLVTLKLLLSQETYLEYQTRLECLFSELSNNLVVINLNRIYRYMGLPRNWQVLAKL